VPDASRISPPVLLPGFPNPVRLGLSVEAPISSLKPGDFRSSLHTVVESEDNHTKLFRLQPGDRLNRDFILRFRVAHERIVSSLALQPDREGAEGTFLLTLVPPAANGHIRPRDIVFVLDRSGSMGGWKMVAARRALARMVDTLGDRDRFTVLAFDDRVETPPDSAGRLVPATNRLRYRAVEFLAKIEARGGTEMAEPLNRAVNELSGDSGTGRERILVLVTDGQVGNEDQILRRLGSRVKGLRIFTLGIDQAVNAGFLRRLADLGGGRSEIVESEDRLDEVMDSIHRHIGTPVLTGLRLERAGLKFLPESVVPGRSPDLFDGTPLLISGRYRGDADGAIALQACDAAGKMWLTEIRGRRVDNPALTTVWARGRLRELEDRYAIGSGKALEREIVATSLRFGVLCRFTAFVAVDRSEVVNPGGQVHGIVQPVEQPEGWESLTLSAAAGTPAYRAPVCDGILETRLPRSATRAPVRGGDFEVRSESIEMDCRSELPRASRMRRKAARVPGVIERLLSMFGRKKSKAASQVTFDRATYRQRVLDLFQCLQSSAPNDAAGRLVILRGLSTKLEELFKDLIAAGDRDPSVKELGEAVLRLHTLLSQSQPAETEVLAVWTQIENCLQRWLALGETTESPRREGFWK
jgi:Ca-activated chloride channel family protein